MRILIGSFLFIFLMIVNIDIEMNEQEASDLNPLGIEAVIYPNEAIAQTSCTFSCLRDLESCSGQNCSNKWICASGCGTCSFEWIKFGEYTTGKCNNSSPGEG